MLCARLGRATPPTLLARLKRAANPDGGAETATGARQPADTGRTRAATSVATTMTTIEQRRAWVVTKLIAGEVGVAEAAELLGLSARSIWRLKRRFGGRARRAGPRQPRASVGAPDGRGRPGPGSGPSPGPSTTAPTTATSPSCWPSARGSASAGSASGGSCGRPASPVRAPARARHRSRRDRMPQAGMLLQTDGSRHDWLEAAGAAADPRRGHRRRDRDRHRGDLPRAGGRGRLSDRAARHDPAARRPAGALSRPPRDLRDPEGAAPDARGAARRPAQPDPVRTRPG